MKGITICAASCLVKTLPTKITRINSLSIYGNTPVSNRFKSTKTKVEMYQRNGGNLVKKRMGNNNNCNNEH